MAKKASRRLLKDQVDAKLDEALKDTFPASDPVAITQPAPATPSDRHSPTVEDVSDKDKG